MLIKKRFARLAGLCALLLTLSALSPLCAVAAPEAADAPLYQLVVTSQSGAQLTFALTDEPVITFTDATLSVRSQKADATWQLADAVSFTFAQCQPDGLRDLATGRTLPEVRGAQLLVSAKQGERVRVVAADGRVLGAFTASESGRHAWPLSSLQPGTCVVSVGSDHFKILVR